MDCREQKGMCCPTSRLRFSAFPRDGRLFLMGQSARMPLWSLVSFTIHCESGDVPRNQRRDGRPTRLESKARERKVHHLDCSTLRCERCGVTGGSALRYNMDRHWKRWSSVVELSFVVGSYRSHLWWRVSGDHWYGWGSIGGQRVA